MNIITRWLRLILAAMAMMVVATGFTASASARAAELNVPAETQGAAAPAADGLAHKTTMAEVNRFADIANNAFAGSPCAGRINFVLATQEVLLKHLISDPSYSNTQTWGVAGAVNGPGVTLNCDLYLFDEIHDVTLCTTMVHEAGHLAGLGHSLDPLSIMYGSNTVAYTPCKERFYSTQWQSSRYLASYAVALRAPGGGADCKRYPRTAGVRKYVCYRYGSTDADDSYYLAIVSSNYFDSNGNPQAKVTRLRPKSGKRAYVKLGGR